MLKLENITKKFLRLRGDSNYFTSVEETNLHIQKGDFITIIGKSGSGKSTLLNMASSLLRPTEGRVLFNDISLYDLKDKELSQIRNKSFGIISQGQSILSSLTILENILLPSLLFNSPSKELCDKAYELMERLNIKDLSNERNIKLSGGELRRVSIARALLKEPEIIFADECTGDLDEENTEIVLDLLKDYTLKGKAVLMVSHDKEAIGYSKEVYSMNKGQLTRI